MFGRLLLLFVAVPIIELSLLIRIGDYIGFWPTVGIILLTGTAGSFFARREGFSVWRRLNERLAKGQLPGQEMMDGVLILLAGALLITPGVLTDVVGFLALLPPSRRLIGSYVQKRLGQSIKTGNVRVNFGGFGPMQRPSPPSQPEATNPQWGGTARETPSYKQNAPEGGQP